MIPIPALIGLIAQVAPTVVRWVAGDESGKAAEQAAELAMRVSGSGSVEEAIQRIRTDQELQRKYQIALVQEETRLEALYLEDRQSARARDVELRKAGYNNPRADILAIIAITALAGLGWMMVFKQLPDGPGRDLLLMIAGALIAVVKDVYSFEFGSSRGSKEKTILLDHERF